MPKLSVIIPTHNRPDTLRTCLEHLERQTIADQLEVIVVNDNEKDKETIQIANQDWRISVHCETIAPCQQGAARNRGIALAQSSTVLLLGDDMFLKQDACALHESIHRNRSTPCAVLGEIAWDPNLEVTPVMEWLMISGWQFGYPKIQKYAGNVLPKSIQPLIAYTSNISLNTEVATRLPFLEDVSLYGWEDIEWGMRLRDAGISIRYEPLAIGYHHHHMILKDSLKRMETLGKAAVQMKEVVPEFDRVPSGWKRIAYEIAARMPGMAGRHRRAFLAGIKNCEYELRREMSFIIRNS